ncbi:15_t:CDS:2 [Funneliformis geosporum]|uniref:5047_t:CDS:1 n=1 Tax=Funneliformis geosporum TaxID=1117311 RepID=A0A9W4SHZ1_9GLOM|nr:15_t:CDS:2 [Funneliformis geosporum]CAI2170123.1 5047_t:CDS:2 [Funneliformis geosporum]
MSTTKLGILLVRTLAKPIANSIKNYSKRHATFRQMCINIAQATHRFEIKLKMNLLSQKRKPEKIRPLNDAKAVEMGANFLGEAVIFGVASSLIIWEQARSYKMSKDRQHHLNDQIEKLQEETKELKSNIEINRSFEDRMMNHLEELKNDNEKLRDLLDRLLIKGLEPRNSEIKGLWTIQVPLTIFSNSLRLNDFMVLESGNLLRVVFSQNEKSTLSLFTSNITGFAILYTIGNIISLMSTGFLVGFKKQIKTMFAPVRWFASLIFLGTLVLTLVVAFTLTKLVPFNAAEKWTFMHNFMHYSMVGIILVLASIIN